MGFKPLNKEQTSSVQKPWANELVSSDPTLVGKVWDVQLIKLKPKGMIIECLKFSGWYFKSTQEYKFLVEYLETWYESQQCNPILQIQLTEEAPYFVLGEDDERSSYKPWSLRGTDFCQVPTKAMPEPELKLSLPNVPSNSEQSSSSEQLDELAERKANQARQQTGKKKPPEEPTAGVVARK